MGIRDIREWNGKWQMAMANGNTGMGLLQVRHIVIHVKLRTGIWHQNACNTKIEHLIPNDT